MVEMKSVGCTDSFSKYPFLDAILYGKRGFSIGKDDRVAPFFQSPAQTRYRLCRSGPFPIAEEV
jgi:hypothetical protein